MKIEDQKLKGLEMTCIYYSALDDWRGGTAGLKNMLHIFQKFGIKINLISYNYYSNKFHIKHENINPLLNSTTIHLPSYLPKFIKAFSIFLAFVHAWRPIKKCDMIFAHMDVLSGVPAAILGRISGKPAILHYIDEEPHHFPDTIYKYIVNNADAVFAISPYLINKAKKYGCKNVVYLPAFVDTKLFSRDTIARRKIRAEWGIKDDDIVIGYAGGFSVIEGVSVLLYAFKNLTKSYPNIKMIIMGGKQSKNDENIPKLVKDLNVEDKVTLIPPQPHEQVPKFLSACDITCCPKIDCAINRAANPIKVVEYLSMGLPTVCSAVGGITYTIEDGVDGLLVKPGDVKDLEEKLEWVISNPERAKEIGENGRKTAIEKYSSKALQDTIRKAISDVIERRGNKKGD
ncbi:MAG: GDP-mannose-dependent alpha-(1-6)-phosphatidylinositol monomannoside mannosyltransferase [candidate division WS2 bacterium]|nr:GDP-mannose-dependent alpha-(1-6)-phosphatidylinositol monomannoside mannosyltransferase [Candidatus Psychracetigena formicireducens]